jgi:hypothetical protein
VRAADRRALLATLRTDLDTLDSRLADAFANAQSWAALGYSAGGGASAHSGTSDPVGEVVAAGAHDVFAADVSNADQRLAEVHRTIRWLVRFSIRHTELALPRQTYLECANERCERTMSGKGDDRPRLGECPRCYKWRRRHGRPWPERRVSPPPTP